MGKSIFNFEELAVWGKSIDYADMVYRMTENFPDCERFGLTSQLRRAAISISSNIAAGNSRFSSRDYARFLEIAYGSLVETISQLHICRWRNFIDQIDFNNLYSAAEEIARMLGGLRTSVTGNKA